MTCMIPGGRRRTRRRRLTTTDESSPPPPADIDPAPPSHRPHGIFGAVRTAFISFEQRDFRYLGLSSLALGFGQWGQQIALAVLAYDLTGSAFQLGAVAAFRGGTGLLTAPLGGYFADRYARRAVIMWSTVASAIQALLFAALILSGHIELWHVYVLAFAGGVIQSISQPARQSFVYDVSTDETLMNAVAMNSVMQNVARIAGPPLAGAVIGLWGTGTLFASLAGTQLIALMFTTMISHRTRQMRRVRTAGSASPFREMWDGFSYVGTDRTLLGLMISHAIPMLLVVPYLPFLLKFATDVLGRGPAAYGLLSSMAGWGSIVGLMVLVSLGDPKRKGLLMIGVFLGYMTMVLIFTRSTNFALSLALLAGAGVFSSVGFALNNTLLQVATENEYRGRVMSSYQLVSGLQSLGGLPMGLAIERYGAADGVAIFVVVGIAAWAVFGLVFGSVRRM